MTEILKIEMQNYRQYHGETTIDLNTDGGRTINIIEGQNGAGKSNILNAVTLCFYEQETHQSEDLDTLPYVSESVLEDLDPGEKATGYIEVHLGEEEPRYIFRREFETYVTPGDYNDQTKDLKLRMLKNDQYELVQSPLTTLNGLLPAEVKDYFIFDGEALTEFFEEGFKQRVRDGIIDVSHIGVLNDSIDHLDTVRGEIQRKAGNIQGEPAKIQEEIDEVEAEIDQLEDRVAELEEQRDETQSQIDTIETKLRGASDAEVQELVETKDSLKQDIKDLKQERDDLRQKALNKLIRVGPAVYATRALEFTEQQLDELSEKGQLPPKVQDWFIEELIEDGECFCGRPIEAGSDVEDHLQELRNSMSDVSTDQLEGKSEIPRVIREGNDGAEEIRDLRRRISDKDTKIRDKEQSLKEKKEKLRGVDVPDDIDVSELATQQDDLEDQKEELNIKIGQKQNQIDNKQDEVNRLEERQKEELRKKGRSTEILQQVSFAETALEEMRGVREEILTRIRRETEQNMNHYFNDLIWKEDEYEIHLADDYGVEIQSPDSTDNRIGSLSAGEKQVLALSFMAALSDISGFSAPVLIDTPLGRISSKPKERIAQNLPDYLEDTQMTFLMTDEEYTDEVQGQMQHRVANEYQLVYSNGKTKVVPQ